MKNKRHVMVDIETLGKKDGATIFQIGAAAFNIETAEVHTTINLKLDVKKANLQVDGDTLKWWLNKDKELLTQLLNEGKLTESEMYLRFFEWLITEAINLEESNTKELVLWGNGIMFDNIKLKQKMEEQRVEFPIHYRNNYDVRTIVALASEKSGLSENELKNKVTLETDIKHEALSDVLFQIRLVCYCYEVLTK